MSPSRFQSVLVIDFHAFAEIKASKASSKTKGKRKCLRNGTLIDSLLSFRYLVIVLQTRQTRLQAEFGGAIHWTWR